MPFSLLSDCEKQRSGDTIIATIQVHDSVTIKDSSLNFLPSSMGCPNRLLHKKQKQYQWRLQRLSTQMQRVASLLSAGAEPDKAGYAVLGNPN